MKDCRQRNKDNDFQTPNLPFCIPSLIFVFSFIDTMMEKEKKLARKNIYSFLL